MKRFLIFAALCVGVWAARPQAEARTCIDRNTCKAPPCEFVAQLVAARARAHIGSFFEELAREIDAAVKQYHACAPQSANFRVAEPPSCAISPSVSDAVNTSTSCREGIMAERQGAEHLVQICRLLKRENASQTTIDYYSAANKRIAAQKEVEYLEAELLKYLSSCAPSPELAQQLIDAGMIGLLFHGNETYQNWQASRASGGGR
jgi:hypothetical protein